MAWSEEIKIKHLDIVSGKPQIFMLLLALHKTQLWIEAKDIPDDRFYGSQ